MTPLSNKNGSFKPRRKTTKAMTWQMWAYIGLLTGLVALVLYLSFRRTTPETSSTPVVSSGPLVPDTLDLQVLMEYPHDNKAFTQGMTFYRGELYESTGHYGRSTLRKVDLHTGQVLQKVDLEYEHFGEGLTILNDRMYFLTWRSRVGFVYDMDFKRLTSFPLQSEGWGLTHSDTDLILSDGSHHLYFLSPKTLKVKRKIVVRAVNHNGDLVPVNLLNELEYINGYIYANVWYTRKIAVIHPKTGFVHRWLMIPETVHATNDMEAVPNGIAFDSATGRLFITGKLWDKVFEVQADALLPQSS